MNDCKDCILNIGWMCHHQRSRSLFYFFKNSRLHTCTEMRANPKLCGPDAVFFQPREEKPKTPETNRSGPESRNIPPL
jgi:hypothetical protein